ncbi:sugar transferase [Campylobacter jejuni]|uniref:sugar transferase n=1 Tax=Campylobacter jejuni TaxID=197 RepID=UPI000874BF14|nr:sugar transferase [Campylobacter jejuni]ECO3963512.1 sugar transferase [Campylobacter jejuni]EGN5849049.1 sugar transferase [Campylobacter jejuni]OEW54992.1 sugar transferase [Campylobacter jejuni]HEF5073823.1 sugar transferase [Campylobacter jejuni]HEG2430935.1 sugar transferase [Campylobacter jejuni]
MKKVIAARQDGLCSRLGAMLNAMYLAKVTKKDFYYYWPDSEEQMKKWEDIKSKNNFRSLECDNEKNIFSKDFIERFSMGDSLQNPGIPYGLKKHHSVFKITLEELMHQDEDIYVSHIPCYNYIDDIDKEDYYENMKNLWQQIDFHPRIKNIINKSKKIAKQLDGFIAIHIRIADVALNELYKNTGFFIYKFSPLELVFEIIKKEIKYNKIVLLADDFDGAKILKNYCYRQKIKNIFIIDEFMEDVNYSENDRAFFEISFMTFAKKVYTGDSNFSKFASRVGLGEEAIYISQMFSNQQRYDLIITNGDDNLILKPLQEAYKYLYLYTRGRLIKKPWSELENIAFKALGLDPANSLYKICILECFLRQKYYEKAEVFLIDILRNDFVNFIKDLLNPMMIFKDSFFEILSQTHVGYEKLHLLYLFMFKNDKKLLGAPSRIKNHLAYRLGQIAVTNSKTIGGYFKLPFNLIKEYKQYNQEQKNYQMMIKLNPTLALPKLKEYADYQEAVKIKKYFSYRLGEAIIQANNTWYGGGYIKLWFEIYKLKNKITKD